MAVGRDPDVDIVWYYPKQSYTDAEAFIRVWNYGTPEFDDDLTSIFVRLSWGRIYRRCFELPPSRRGNRQECFGYSAVNIGERCPVTSVAIPALNPHTNEWQDEFVKMSALASHLGIVPGAAAANNRDLFRFLNFAGRINPFNLFEGDLSLSLFSLALALANSPTAPSLSLYPLPTPRPHCGRQ